jgi:hypothetical protein
MSRMMKSGKGKKKEKLNGEEVGQDERSEVSA